MVKSINLKEYLCAKNCLKIICGANNENFVEIEKLVALYSMAGCRFFDINASIEALNAAIRGLKYSNCFDDEHFICLSIGVDYDIHFKKCKINNEICTKCEICKNSCPQNAINNFEIDEKKCIGCSICIEKCHCGAIESYQVKKNITQLKDLFSLVDCVELHISTDDINEIKLKWSELISNYDGLISICMNRAIFSEDFTIKLFNELIQSYSNIMIQADGKPMSGINNDYNTTLQAVAFADILRKSNITCPIFVSGGTNSKTKELLKLCSVDVNGISFGSCARKIVKKYIDREDFFENKQMFNEAYIVAKDFVDMCK